MGSRRFVLVPALFLGCAAPLTTPAPGSIVDEGISVTARVEAWEESDSFLTVLNVQEIAADGTLSTLTMPRVVVCAGQEAELVLAAEPGQRGVRARVQMPSLDDLEHGAWVEVQVFRDDELIAAPSIIVDVPCPDDDDPAGRTISCLFESEDVHAVLDHFAKRLGLDIVAPRDLEGTITLRLDAVEGRLGLASALEPLGFTFEEDGTTVRVVPLSEENGASAIESGMPLGNSRPAELRHRSRCSPDRYL